MFSPQLYNMHELSACVLVVFSRCPGSACECVFLNFLNCGVFAVLLKCECVFLNLYWDYIICYQSVVVKLWAQNMHWLFVLTWWGPAWVDLRSGWFYCFVGYRWDPGWTVGDPDWVEDWEIWGLRDGGCSLLGHVSLGWPAPWP